MRAALTEKPFTIECRRIFRRAEDLARGLGHPTVATEHLLLAVLDVPTFSPSGIGAVDPVHVRAVAAARIRHGDDANALALLGIDRADVLERIGVRPDPAAALAWTDLAAQVLEDAAAGALGDARRAASRRSSTSSGRTGCTSRGSTATKAWRRQFCRDLGVDRAAVCTRPTTA